MTEPTMSEGIDPNSVRKVITVQAPHALMQSHGVPRKIDVNETVTALLKVDSFATGLRGN